MPTTRPPRDYRKKAQALWPEADGTTGDGPFVCVSLCPPETTVVHYATFKEALAGRLFLYQNGCGGQCEGRHDVWSLDEMWSHRGAVTWQLRANLAPLVVRGAGRAS